MLKIFLLLQNLCETAGRVLSPQRTVVVLKSGSNPSSPRNHLWDHRQTAIQLSGLQVQEMGIVIPACMLQRGWCDLRNMEEASSRAGTLKQLVNLGNYPKAIPLFCATKIPFCSGFGGRYGLSSPGHDSWWIHTIMIIFSPSMGGLEKYRTQLIGQ